MIDVTNALKVYEVNGKEVTGIEADPLVVLIYSHKLYDDRIVINVLGERYTVLASDVRAAVENATNRGRR